MLLFQDEHVVVAAKPAGMLVHRGWANDRCVLMTEVRDRIGCWVYPVHRLDRGASGAVLFALSAEMARVLSLQFAEQRVRKRYVALVRGVPPESGIIDHPIPNRPKGPRVDAVTEYRRLRVFGRYSLVEARPKTGRLHQIRRHLKHVSCPLIGDVKYGKGEHNQLFRDKYGLNRLALHACAIGFTHPMTGAPFCIEAPLPDDLRHTIAVLDDA